MASTPSTLRVARTELYGSATRTLEIVRADGAPFTFGGGQYVIINTGVVLADGKLVKRAYSLMPVPGDPSRARLAIKRLGDGPGSRALHDAAVGSEFLFSGPWGKLVPEGGLSGPTLIVATDTGITAALSVVERARAAPVAQARNASLVLWLRGADETFLDVDHVRSRAEAAGVRFVAETIPPVLDAARIAIACERSVAHVVETGARLVLAAGDGAVLYPLRDRLLMAEVGVGEVRIDCFFNNPDRKIG